MSYDESFHANLIDRKPKRLSKDEWLDKKEPQIILFQGMRGSGKGVSVESKAEELYNEGFNIWHLWSARSFENLFWMINMNCKEKFSKMKTIAESFLNKDQYKISQRCMNTGKFESLDEFWQYFDLMVRDGLMKKFDDGSGKLTEEGMKLAYNEVLHCKCSKAYPILWFAPNYIEFDESSLDRFNAQCWDGMNEYSKYNLDITTENKKLLLEGKLLKPTELRPKKLIKIFPFTTPTSKTRKEQFKDDLLKAVLQAREERRVFVISPAIFEGALDKFSTVGEIFKMLKWLMITSGHFMELKESQVGKPYNQWSKKQKGWHKVVIVINELRSLSPSSKMSGEKESTTSKRAIFDYVPEARHYKTWFLGDYQNPKDVFDGVRHQANLVIIKRASRNILGDDWGWLFDRVIKDRMGFIRGKFKKNIESVDQIGFFEKRFPKIKQYNDERRPYIGNLPSNEAYVTWPNNEIKKVRIELPNFHHRQSLDDFKRITGIEWSVNMELKPKESMESVEDDKAITKENKARKEDLMKRIDYMHVTEGKPFKIIKEEIAELEAKGIIPNMEYASKEPVYFNNLWSRWKKKQALGI